MIQSACRWVAPAALQLPPEYRAAGAQRGLSPRLLGVLAARGVADASALDRFLAPAEEALHDPALLPDAAAALQRVTQARARSERVLVYGDFDADGLSGLAILTLALRRLGLDAAPYVPERLGDGHGLSQRALERASAEGRTLIVTADCGTSSGPEIEAAAGRGIDVIVTDHHHAAALPTAAVAVVNPVRADSTYPERTLTGAGVAWKLAHLLLGDGGSALPDPVRELADLALIGTVADVAPILGENRSLARIGLEQLRRASRPGLAALLERAGLRPDRLDLDDIGFAIAPRLNAAGRVGEAARAARLLLADDRGEADALADEIEAANRERRELTRTALAEARGALGLDPGTVESDQADLVPSPDGVAAAALPGASATALPAALLVRGEWPVGIIGLIAGRLSDNLRRPVVVATPVDEESGILRASCRSPKGHNLAETLVACEDLLIRHGGHAAAAGFDIQAARWAELQERFVSLIGATALPPGPAELWLDLVLPAIEVDYDLVRDLGRLEPTGPGNPRPTLGVTGLTVVRARSAAGGHTQLVLGRGRDVLDAVAFRRPDLATALRAGDRIDIATRVASRSFGGFESIQLEVLDVAAEGAQAAVSPRAMAG
jgi:single-stranded-DNA-specific exonuclease